MPSIILRTLFNGFKNVKVLRSIQCDATLQHEHITQKRVLRKWKFFKVRLACFEKLPNFTKISVLIFQYQAITSSIGPRNTCEKKNIFAPFL